MVDTEYLNEWQGDNGECRYTDIEQGKPQWFKLWVEKYATALDIDNLDTDLTPPEKDKLFKDVGIAFINSLFYFLYRVDVESEIWEYKPKTRDGRILWNALKRDIDQSYRDYEERVRNGAKGGRPPKKP